MHFWNLCQPLAVGRLRARLPAGCVGAYGWQTMLILEGCAAIYLSAECGGSSSPIIHATLIGFRPPSGNHLENNAAGRKAAQMQPASPIPILQPFFLRWEILVMVIMNFFHNCRRVRLHDLFNRGG